MKISFINLIDLPKEIQLDSRNWRNSASVIKYFTIQFIDEKTHQKWLDSMKENAPKNIAFAMKMGEDFVGMIYLMKVNLKNQMADVGIYIHRDDLRGLGLGQKAFEFVINFAKNNLKLSKLNLEVLKDNRRAIKLYEKMGFKCVGEKNDKLFAYELRL